MGSNLPPSLKCPQRPYEIQQVEHSDQILPVQRTSSCDQGLYFTTSEFVLIRNLWHKTCYTRLTNYININIKNRKHSLMYIQSYKVVRFYSMYLKIFITTEPIELSFFMKASPNTINGFKLNNSSYFVHGMVLAYFFLSLNPLIQKVPRR